MRNLYLLLLLLPVLAFSQNQNYIRTTTYKKPVSAGSLSTPSDSVAVVSTTYFDGLGRPIQKVAHKQSAEGHDIITPIVYDTLQNGRQLKDYLPYASAASSLDYQDNATVIASLEGYYTTQYGSEGGNPYSEKVLEASPLGTVLKQGAPGTPWAVNPNGADHSVKFEYQTNEGPSSSSGRVKKYLVKSELNPATQIYRPDSGITYTYNGTEYYAAGELYKTITKNENWVSGTDNTTEEFKDKQGKLILRRTYAKTADANGNDGANSVVHETYYIYDQFGNLSFVSTPLSNGNVTLSSFGNLGYSYFYDSRNRLAEKKLPQKTNEFIVYDQLDRVVATGPHISPFPGVTTVGWLFTKYDAYSRVAFTGWFSSGGTITSAKRKTLQDSYNGAVDNVQPGFSTVDGVQVYYSPTSLPAGFKLLTVNYYDGYRFVPIGIDLPADVEGQPYITELPLSGISVKGLQAGSWVRVLTSASETLNETSYTLYDAKSRPIRTYVKNHMGGYTYTDSKLRFTGAPDYTVTKHKRTNAATELVTKDVFTYTDQERLDKHTHEIVGYSDPQLMGLNKYTPLGELVSKKVGGPATGLDYYQKVDFAYNIRGWLKAINPEEDRAIPGTPADLFNFKIEYNDPVISANALYNGNISETSWKTNGTWRRYDYTYDTMNRLKKASYAFEGAVTNSYNEQISYDKNGNIRKLLRNGIQDDPTEPIEIDNLSYVYSTATTSNKLLAVNDATLSASGFKDGTPNNAEDYTYDVYGNIISDENKGITQIQYNHLNLPKKIVFGGTGESIEYLYNALGNKVRKTVNENLPTLGSGPIDYVQGFQYMNGHLQFFPTAEGYVDCTTLEGFPVFKYVYQYKDHLGNVRVNYTKDQGILKIKQEQHYYPFGLEHQNYANEYLEFRPVNENVVELRGKGDPAPELPPYLKQVYNYKYNGKEFQDELGLGLYAMDARQYDPAIGRFTSIDPIVHHSQSTYAAFDNNPAFWADPSGAAAVYNWDGANKGQYTDGGKVVDFSTAMASHGLNSDGSDKTSDDDGGNVAKPLTKSVLLQYVKENYCEDCSSGKLQQVTGQFFERQFEAFASGVTPSKFKFRRGTKLYGPRNTVPDFIADFIREYKSGRASTRVQGAVAYEVKAMNGSLYLSSNTNQLMGHIDNLSDKFRFMTSYGKPHLTLATTYDVNIGASVTNRAAEKGVGLNQVVSYYTMVNNQMIITFGPRVNATEIQNAIKN